MKHSKKAILVLQVIVLIFLLVGVASAAADNPQDVTVDLAGGTADNSAILTVSSGNFGGCQQNSVVYLQWGLANVNGAASVADATNKTALKVNVALSLGAGDGKLGLYQVLNDGWTETTIDPNNPPAVGTLIEEITTPGSGLATFSNQALADYINSQSAFVNAVDTIAGDNKASFALQITGCANLNDVLTMDSKENPAGTPPSLNLFGPTAVTLQNFRSVDPAVNWPLYAGLGVLALLVIAGGAAFLRRRVVGS